jgi:hypothetical protein
LTRTRALTFILIVLCVAALRTAPALADCVIKPSLPPALPPGCVELVPDCLCDDHGQNCHWVYHCVTNK